MTFTVSISALLVLVGLADVVGEVRVSPFRTPVAPSAFGDVADAATAVDGKDAEADNAWKKEPADRNGDERMLRGVLRLFPFSESVDGKGLRSLFRVSGPLPSAITTSTLEVLDGMRGMGFLC